MAKATSRVPKFLRKSDPMKTKTGKPRLSTLSLPALETLKKTTKPKNMSMVDAEITARIRATPAPLVQQVIVPLIMPTLLLH